MSEAWERNYGRPNGGGRDEHTNQQIHIKTIALACQPSCPSIGRFDGLSQFPRKLHFHARSTCLFLRRALRLTTMQTICFVPLGPGKMRARALQVYENWFAPPLFVSLCVYEFYFFSTLFSTCV